MENSLIEKEIRDKWGVEFGSTINYIVNWLRTEPDFRNADRMLIEGLGYEKMGNYCTAISFYDKSAASGNIIGKYYTAWLRRTEYGLDFAFYYYLDAASLGHIMCIKSIRKIYIYRYDNKYIYEILRTDSICNNFNKLKIEVFKYMFDDDVNSACSEQNSSKLLLTLIDFDSLNRKLCSNDEKYCIRYLIISDENKKEIVYYYHLLLSSALRYPVYNLYYLKNIIIKYII